MTHKALDREWIVLLNEAKRLGLAPEDIRTFLQEKIYCLYLSKWRSFL
ncbi:anti-repressor SinI family protein [Halobacillus andaensis]|nr:anti-repressor SinI family protein [Halobacillus andaensis]